jgi:hypothetical protein
MDLQAIGLVFAIYMIAMLARYEVLVPLAWKLKAKTL